MEMVELTQQIPLLDCGAPLSEERRSSEMDLSSDLRFLPATVTVAGCWLLLALGSMS
jgi:hypothetical protein